MLRERVVHLSHIEGTTISDIVTKNGIARTNLHRRLPPRLPQVITVGGPAPPPRDKRAVGRGSNHVVRKPGTTTPVLSHFLGCKTSRPPPRARRKPQVAAFWKLSLRFVS